jgi:hypothetical protein
LLFFLIKLLSLKRVDGADNLRRLILIEGIGEKVRRSFRLLLTVEVNDVASQINDVRRCKVLLEKRRLDGLADERFVTFEALKVKV